MSAQAPPRRQRWPAALSLLTNRNFVPIWLCGGSLTIAKAIRNVALMKLIYDLTGSAGGVGVMIASDILSGVIILPLAGVLADRFNRKKLMISVDILRAGLTFLLLCSRSSTFIYVLNFALASSSMCYYPARSALVPDLVKKEQLLDANALSNSLGTLGRVLGPLLGGIVVDRFSIQVAFVLSASLYVVSVLGTSRVQVAPRSLLRGKASVQAVYEALVEGIRYARQNPVVSAMMTIYLSLFIGWGLSMSLDVVYAEQVLSSEYFSNSKAYSYMLSIAAAGMFVGTLVVRYLNRHFSKKRLWLLGLSMMSLDALGLSFVRSLPLALTAKFCHGIGTGLSDSLWPTLLQENVEKEQRGRAFGLFISFASIPPVITVYLGGKLADHTSIQFVYGLSCTLMLLTVIGACFLPGYRTIHTTSGEPVSDES